MPKDNYSNNCLCYHDDHNRKWVSALLLASGAKYFQSCFQLLHFSKLESCIKNLNPEKLSENHHILSEFAEESLIDDVKLCIVFESYMKSKLLLEGYLIHRISVSATHDNAAELEKLSKIQKKQPITINEYKCLDKIVYREDQRQNIFPAISEQTLNINQLLNKSYSKVIGLPQDIITLVEKISKHRNQLHYLLGEIGAYSQQTISDLRLAAQFVNANIIKVFNAWVEDEKKPARMKLSLTNL